MEEVLAPLSDQDLGALIEFKDIWHEGKFHSFRPDDLSALLILQKDVSKKVSFERAFRGWRNSPLQGERRLPGRAFYHWMNRHQLSILWDPGDFIINPLLQSPSSPRHQENDELAQGHSFVIRPQMVDGRKIKLYVQDRDMIKLLNLYAGEWTPFEELTKGYIAQRMKWERSCMQAPSFLDWVLALGKRPWLSEGDLGFFPQVSLSSS